MKPRILGEEIEWSAAKRISMGNGKYRFSEFPGYLVSQIFHGIIAKKYPLQENSDLFAPNGGFLRHETMGEHIETSTPECGSLQDITAQSKASELFTHELTFDIAKVFGNQVAFHKKNTDFRVTAAFVSGPSLSRKPGASRGCHENYSVDPLLHEKFDSLKLVPYSWAEGIASVPPETLHFLLFLITRQILSGSGGIKKLNHCPDSYFYFISPRAYHIVRNIASDTTDAGERGIIGWGRQALANEKICGRLHLICGDANMSETSIYLKYGTTCAVLEMLEADAWDRNLIYRPKNNEAKLFGDISRDLTCRNVRINLPDGNTESALGVQKSFQKRFKEYVRANNLSSDHFELAERWGEALECLARDDAKTHRLLDWKIKWKLTKNYCERKSFDLAHEKVLLLDLEYHGVHPEKGVYNKLKNNGHVERILSDSQIEKAVASPPSQTRANARRQLIDILDYLRVRYTLYWTGATLRIPSEWSEFPQNKSCMIKMDNPFVCDLEMLNNPDSKKIIGLLKARTGRMFPLDERSSI